MRKDAIARFLPKVALPEDAGGCWNWCGFIQPTNGYGRFWFRGKRDYAHRAAYEIFCEAVLEGWQIDHLCRNRRCVRPSHLEAVTSSVNTLRSDLYNRHKTHCKNGHPLTPDNVYAGDQTHWRICKICKRASVARYKATPTGGLKHRAAMRRCYERRKAQAS